MKKVLIPKSATLLKHIDDNISASAYRLRYARKLAADEISFPVFPPDPLSNTDVHRILTGIGNAFLPDRFLEAGCAVCGTLYPLSKLTLLADFPGPLTCLEAPGVTRMERFEVEDPIEEIPGPVLAESCSHLCVECEAALVRDKVPDNALAKHCWIGSIPEELSGLTYAEGVMIARVRHNRCVMRVNSGRVRMHANAIMFAQPAAKVFWKLPPTRDEMAELLAFTFIGASAPTQEDFERTSMLVRREKVYTALNWLKLNHEGYTDLEISEDNLMSYKLRDIPVVVDFKRSKGDPNDSIPAIARSVNDSNEEHGTVDGPCSFATIKSVALQHLTREGGMLGIGQSEAPESMFRNVQAYPGMFPWLFPYGKGGIGHPTHANRIADATRKKHLLMYHDKRFQLDMYFPMIAFNHEQIKGSVSGGRALVKRSTYPDISRRLGRINPDVAGSIADRLSQGEHVRPQTDAENDCFDLMRDLD
ncbi:hypothetical protein C8R46DRAFT_924021, partial [Mycena filopes]